MADKRSKGLLPHLFCMPALLFIGLFFVLPIAFLEVSSFIKASPDGSLMFSSTAYATIAEDRYTYFLLWRTFKLSIITTLITFVISFPIALYMRRISPRWQSIVGFILLSPLLTSVVVRTLAWVILLSPRGLINTALASVNMQVELIYNETGVIIGLTHVFVGYMVLSLMTSVSKIDDNLLLAASNLGATGWTTLWRIILPLCLPGIVAGSMLVFTMCASAYVTPVLLGGNQAKVAANEIYSLAVQYLEWDQAGALATFLFISTAVLVWGGTRLAQSGRRKVIFQ